ncbi:MAG TPA: nucleotide-binding protein [Kiritimatiellia bacterium]|uniref:TIR domain-containing protein n=1 Tax=Hydrogenophaga sp. TaxID=1904254 RepID=UPI002B6F2077|nr:TIR domain-containing protein [Hydrogenophaga sp.]HMO52686.1 nucleotide-binding protein [Kiritimatiellia bacterium]HMP11376.1 nucleotide-binding protein [Hydrogenophaga sp.]
MPTRPILFVGSSTEGLPFAQAVQENLDRLCQVVLWSQGVFGLSGGTLEDLVEKIAVVDFGVLVVTPDDVAVSRGKRTASPRDNVLLELGICIGALGRERSFLVHDRSQPLKLPTDLAGITNASFMPHDDGNYAASVGAACTKIERRVKELGERPKYGRAGLVTEDSQFRVIADLLGVVACNYIIQMYELDASMPRERNVLRSLGNYWYGIEFPGKRSGNGRFSVDDLCSKMPDAGILKQDLKFNVSLTDRGQALAKWLVLNNYKAPAFISPLGSWGRLSKYVLSSIDMFKSEAR